METCSCSLLRSKGSLANYLKITADFDGDQLNLTLLPDNFLADACEAIAPHTWVLSTDDPHEISGNLELQGPVVETVVNFAHEDYLPPLEEWLAGA